MIVRRLDMVTLVHADAEETPEGFRLYDALFSRTGLQDYDDGRGGRVIEYRPDAEVFAPESLASYELRPLTDLHPPRNVTTDTAHILARGAVSAGKRHTDGMHVLGRLAVWSDSLIRKFDAARTAGKPMQLSAGYELELDRTPGEYQGRRYDAIQRNIRINHVAAVPLGRAGTARVLDAAAWGDGVEPWALSNARALADVAPHRDRAFVDFGRWCRHDAADLREQFIETTTQDQSPMKKITIKIDGADVVLELDAKATEQDIADAVSKAHTDAAAKADAKRKADAAKLAEKAKAKADAMAPPFGKKPDDEEADKAKAKAKADAEERRRDEKVDALGTARAVLGLSYKADGKDADAIRLDVIERVLGADERKAVEQDRGAIGYVYGKAVTKADADRRHDGHTPLLAEIRASARGKADEAGRTDADGRVAKARRDAAERAAQPRSERKAG